MALGLEAYHYTESEAKNILKSLVYLVDTREQENKHILDTYDKMQLKYKNKALSSGDYSVMLPKNTELGIMHDIYLDDAVVVERKRSLEELSANLAQYRQRFKNELIRTHASVHLVVEDGSYERILCGDYMTALQKKSYYRSLLCLQAEFGLHIHFVPRKLAGFHIAQILECYVKELLKI